MLTQERLQALLLYDPETGVWTWRVNRRGTALAGTRAGRLDGDGYRQIKVDGHLYSAARLAWLYMLGRWPKDEVDHDNRMRDDDRWANMREATRLENMDNADWPRGISGVRNVYPRGERFRVRVRGRCLGTYGSLDEARAVAVAARAN